MDSVRTMRCLMSPRYKQYVESLASSCDLRYPAAGGHGNASIVDGELAAVAFSLCGHAQAGDAEVRRGRDAVRHFRAGGKVGGIGGLIQWVVLHHASNDSAWIEWALVGGSAVASGRTHVHVPGRWENLDGASVGRGLCKGWVWPDQRHCGGQVGTC